MDAQSELLIEPQPNECPECGYDIQAVSPNRFNPGEKVRCPSCLHLFIPVTDLSSEADPQS